MACFQSLWNIGPTVGATKRSSVKTMVKIKTVGVFRNRAQIDLSRIFSDNNQLLSEKIHADRSERGYWTHPFSCGPSIYSPVLGTAS